MSSVATYATRVMLVKRVDMALILHGLHLRGYRCLSGGLFLLSPRIIIKPCLDQSITGKAIYVASINYR